jgi:hypothetical protein
LPHTESLETLDITPLNDKIIYFSTSSKLSPRALSAETYQPAALFSPCIRLL